jgi:hypothetical protein
MAATDVSYSIQQQASLYSRALRDLSVERDCMARDATALMKCTAN